MKQTKTVALVAVLVAVAMLALIVRSSAEMSLGAGLRATVDTWWGITTMADLYVGLAAVAAWIVYRERSAARAAPWIIGLVLLGNLTTVAYLALAAIRSASIDEIVGGRR